MYQISFSREEGTDLYRVRCLAFSQTIVLSRHILVRKIGMDSHCLVGCKEVSIYAIIDLGFIPPVGEKLSGDEAI